MSDVQPRADAEKKRILVLADSHGRNISGILSFVLRRRRSEVLVIFKPNATLGCVAEDIDKLTTSFTVADVVVLIGGTNDLDRGTSAALVSTIDGLQRRLQQRTQLIVATLPRRYDSRKYNRLIDELNGGIRALKSRYERMKILELGDMGKDYHTNQGLHLNVKGKVQLCLKLCKEMDSQPRESILRPPVRKVAEFLKLFTVPDGCCRFNYESPRSDNDVTAPVAPQTRKAKLHRVRYILIETRITVPASVGVQRRISGDTISKPFEVLMAPGEEAERLAGDDISAAKSLRIRRANSYWAAGNTICVQLLCHTTNRCPSGIRLGRREDVKLHVTGSQLRTVFTVAETGLRFAVSQEPAVVIIALDFGNFFNVDKTNVNLTFEESTVRTKFKKRGCELSLNIRGKMWLVYSPGTSCVLANGDSSRTECATKLELDGGPSTFLETLPSAEETDAEFRCIPPDIITLTIRFAEIPFNLRADVAVFRPVLIIASSQLFVIYFHSSDHMEITLYAEIFVITNAVLVRYFTLPVANYVILSSCPKPAETFHDGFSDSRIVPYKSQEAHQKKLYFLRQFMPEIDTSLDIHLMNGRRESSDESELSKDDVILTESLVRLIKRSLLYLKMKNLVTVAGKRGKTCLKQTRKGGNISGTGAQEITKQLTKVTTTYLSCCGDFNSAMIGRRLNSGKERDSDNPNSLL